MGDISANFSASEMACKCANDCEYKDGSLINDGLLADIQVVREVRERPIKITSALRCAEHNASIGSKPDSAHVKGLALDIACNSSTDRWELIGLLRPMFNRIGIGKDFIHVDIDDTKPLDVMWVY